MLYNKNIPLPFWAEAVNTAVYTLNRVASRTRQGLTPHEKWTGSRPDVSHFRVFGSLAYCHVPKETRKKLDSKTRECLFLGYANTSKAYRLWYPAQQRIIISRDVIFDEETLPNLDNNRRYDNVSYSNLFPLIVSGALGLPAISVDRTTVTEAISDPISLNLPQPESPTRLYNRSVSPSGSNQANGSDQDITGSGRIQNNESIESGRIDSSAPLMHGSSSDSILLPQTPSCDTVPHLLGESASFPDSLNNTIRTRSLIDLYTDPVTVPLGKFSSDDSLSCNSSAALASSSVKPPMSSGTFVRLPHEPKTIA